VSEKYNNGIYSCLVSCYLVCVTVCVYVCAGGPCWPCRRISTCLYSSHTRVFNTICLCFVLCLPALLVLVVLLVPWVYFLLVEKKVSHPVLVHSSSISSFFSQFIVNSTHTNLLIIASVSSLYFQRQSHQSLLIIVFSLCLIFIFILSCPCRNICSLIM
jgi:hypothetical protein